MKNFNELNAAEAITLYKSLDLDEVSNEIIDQNLNKDLETVSWPWNRPPKPWEHTSYAYGFIPENATINGTGLTIQEAKSVLSSDDSLKNNQISVSLDFLRVLDYPGKGKHQVLFKFNAINHQNGQDQDLSFNQTFAIQEGQRAPISGYPIFIGLNTGEELVHFDVEIVNVSNDNDDKFLETMKSGVVKNGIKLLNSANPVIPIITEYATGITKMIASRNKNRSITSPKMGLWFGTSPTRMKLSKGVYIAIQTSTPQEFDWTKWSYNRSFGTIQSIDGSNNEIPHNYFVFSISETN